MCLDTIIARYNHAVDLEAEARANVADTAEALQVAIDNEDPVHLIHDARTAHRAAVDALAEFEDGTLRAWMTGRDDWAPAYRHH